MSAPDNFIDAPEMYRATPITAPTTRETADHAGLAAIINDDEIARVHGHANFGPSITPREVVNEGVRKYAVGYHSGYTQLTILLEHGLITKPRPGRYDANLTKKGKKYARVLYRREAALLSEIAALRGELKSIEINHDIWVEIAEERQNRATQAERQRDELRKALDRQCDNMSFVLNRVDLHAWADKFSREVAEDRALIANQGADQ